MKNEPSGKSKVDCGAPKSCANEDYTREYLKSMGLKLDDMPRVQTMDVFCFGPVSRYPTKRKIRIPIKYKDTEGKIHYLETDIHLNEYQIGILIGLDTLDQWNSDVKVRKSGISLPGKNKGEEYIIQGERGEGSHIVIDTIQAAPGDNFT